MVVWSLREQRWLRWTSPVVTQTSALQDNWLLSQQLLGNEPAQLRMHDGLAQWQVYFYRGNAWSNAQSSGDLVTPVGGAASAPAGAASEPARQALPSLPSGVRLVLEFGDGSANIGSVLRDTMLGP